MRVRVREKGEIICAYVYVVDILPSNTRTEMEIFDTITVCLYYHHIALAGKVTGQGAAE